MRTLALKESLALRGAAFYERCGVEVPEAFTDSKNEYYLIRDKVGITDFSYMQKFRIPADTGIDFLDSVFAGNVAKIRFCRVLHTFLADDAGDLAADCYIANNDEEFIVLCESIKDDKTLWQIFENKGATGAGLEDITASHVILSVDGVKAWAVVKELFGADILGLPYLSIETYPFEETIVMLLRAGKTSEFGYLIMAPTAIASRLLDVLVQISAKHEGGLCGVKIHDDLRLEGRFCNIFAEGSRVKDPLILGLQWMIDFEKDAFIGSGPIFKKREQGLRSKIVGLRSSSLATHLTPGAPLFCGKQKVATVQASCFSHVLNTTIALAVFPVELAYAGLTFNLGQPDGVTVETISMPPIVPKSISIKLDEM